MWYDPAIVSNPDEAESLLMSLNPIMKHFSIVYSRFRLLSIRIRTEPIRNDTTVKMRHYALSMGRSQVEYRMCRVLCSKSLST